jgi:glycerol-3-phosphate dehydrogenase (NAD(P)+)
MIAEGKTLKHITEDMNIKAEGINTCKSVHQLSKKYNIKLPISEGVYNILYKNINPSNIISELMERDLRKEF